eukprot:UN3138
MSGSMAARGCHPTMRCAGMAIATAWLSPRKHDKLHTCACESVAWACKRAAHALTHPCISWSATDRHMCNTHRPRPSVHRSLMPFSRCATSPPILHCCL